MIMQTCAFKNKNGLIIKGIVIKPDNDAQKNGVGVLYLPGAVLGSTAVHGLGIELGNLLADKGYSVYLFDHYGIGESDGELPADSSAQMVNLITNGSLVDDTTEMLSFIEHISGINAVLLMGHCGGGITAAYVVNEFHLIKGLICISTPILSKGENDLSQTRGAIREYSTLYKNKMFSLLAWKKLLIGKTDYSLLVKFIINKLFKKPMIIVKKQHINKRFFDGLMKAKRDKKIFMIMGERDPGIDEFRDFCDAYLDKDKESAILKYASHGFVTKESKDLLFAEIDKFVGSFN